MPSPLFLLDTNVMLALIRGRELGSRIDARFGLRSSPVRPLTCIVSHGELWALADPLHPTVISREYIDPAAAR